MTEPIFKPYEHCQECGSEDSSNEFNQGYSSCCNEIIVWPTSRDNPCGSNCYHDGLDEDRDD